MKRFLSLGVTILASVTLFAASPADSRTNKFYVALQGGPMLNVYENAFSYWDNHCLQKLITLQGGVAVGYAFTDVFSLRLSASYAKNAGACNVRETSGNGFYPYTFHSVNTFADAVLDLNGLAGKLSAFRPLLYGGLGCAYSFDFTDPKHPWQKLETPDTSFGFRFGFIAEYGFSKHFGIYADLCGEGYTDLYNGLAPSRKEQQENFEGYGGFPLDLRGLASLGLIFWF